MKTMIDISVLLSNLIAVPMVALSFYVVKLWYKPAKRIMFKNSSLTTEGWFIIGVFFGFFGEFIDNLYWLVVWSLVYLEYAQSSQWVTNGVFINIPFRQCLGIFAAYCHIRSALQYKSNKKGNEIKYSTKLLLGWTLVGLIFAVVLLGFK